MIASGSRHSLALVSEGASYGVTPTTPVFEPIRYTSCSLALKMDQLRSEELVASRHVTSQAAGAKKAGGDIGVELSYGSLDTILQAVMCGTWTNNVLKAGTTRRSFTIERRFEDLGEFQRYKGSEFDKLQLQASANAIVKGTLSVLAQDMALDTAIVTGATYSAVGTNPPIVSFRGVVEEGGVATTAVSELSLSVDNGLEALYAIGSRVTNQPSIGRSNVSGQMSVYLEDSDLIDKFLDETESSLEATFSDAAGRSIALAIPRLLYTDATYDVKGPGPVIMSVQFQGLLDSVSGSNLVLTRNPGT